MKKLSLVLMFSVLLFGVSMANAILWEEDFEGFNDSDDFIVLDPNWSKTIRFGLPGGETEASWISGDGFIKTANQDYAGWTRSGNNITNYRDLSGVTALTGNTINTILYIFDVTSQSGVTYANRTAVHFDLVYPFDGSEDYEFLRVATDWNGFKLNDSVVLNTGLNDSIPLGRYTVTLDMSTQQATLQIDSAFGGGSYITMDDSGGPVSLPKDFRTVGWAPDVGPGDIKGAWVRLVYYDAGGHTRSAMIQWDSMAIRVPPPAFCGDEDTVYLPADLSKDCKINLKDFGLLAAQWMQCTHPDQPQCDQYWK